MSTRGRDKRLNVPYFEVQVSWQSQHLVDFDVQIPPAHYPPPTFSESEFSQHLNRFTSTQLGLGWKPSFALFGSLCAR